MILLVSFIEILIPAVLLTKHDENMGESLVFEIARAQTYFLFEASERFEQPSDFLWFVILFQSHEIFDPTRR